MSDDPIAKAEEIQERKSRAIAQELAPEAVGVLGSLMRGKSLPGRQRATPSVMRQAAVDILAHAHGRPETRDPRVAGGGSGVVVNIIKFGPEAQPAIEAAREVAEVVAMAQEIQARREPVPIEAEWRRADDL